MQRRSPELLRATLNSKLLTGQTKEGRRDLATKSLSWQHWTRAKFIFTWPSCNSATLHDRMVADGRSLSRVNTNHTVDEVSLKDRSGTKLSIGLLATGHTFPMNLNEVKIDVNLPWNK